MKRIPVIWSVLEQAQLPATSLRCPTLQPAILKLWKGSHSFLPVLCSPDPGQIQTILPRVQNSSFIRIWMRCYISYISCFTSCWNMKRRYHYSRGEFLFLIIQLFTWFLTWVGSGTSDFRSRSRLKKWRLFKTANKW